MTDLQRATGLPGSQRAYWLCQLAGWGLYGLSQFYAAIWFLDAPWGRVAAEILVLHAAGLGLTHALRVYARRRLWNALPVLQLAWRIVLASVVLAVPMGLATNFLVIAGLHNPAIVMPEASTNGGPPLMTLFRISLQVANWTLVFTVWLVIYSIGTRLREQRFAELRQSELARALQLAELRLLKSQLNPHFLFNALNTVRSLVAHDPSRAQDAVTRLANTLRYTLNSSHDELVTLAQELEIVNDYLELESMRFEERLSVELEIPSDLRSTRIPVMLLQTVVENAIKHGIAALPAGGMLRIQAVLRDDTVVIRVENPKPPAQSGVAHEGVGLRNSAERLRLLFGSRAGLELDLSQPRVATTLISVPRNL
jgi:Histidine kinase